MEREIIENAKEAHEKSAPDASLRLIEDVIKGRPEQISDKQLDAMAGNVYDSIAKDYNSGKGIQLGPEHPTHAEFDKAMQAGRLEDLVNKVEEKIWAPDGIHHVDLTLSEGPRIGHAINKTITLTHTHTGQEISHDDVHKMISDPFPRRFHLPSPNADYNRV